MTVEHGAHTEGMGNAGASPHTERLKNYTITEVATQV